MADYAFCHRCNRPFSHHTLLIHEPKCKHRNSSRRFLLNKKIVISKKEKLERPRTSSISKSNKALIRLCFVCGKEIEEDIKFHEENCFEEWSTSVQHLSKKFDLRVPKRLYIPSVDGTQDISRLNEHAALQSALAQIVHCKRCHAQMPVHEAGQHKCMKFDPPVEFFF
uniref:C2H2-type domain-containing protein n=1 Tax=Heterorhabditis bacteriophora TaxID=37862 RepID=A0A1I7WVL1_HETBA